VGGSEIGLEGTAHNVERLVEVIRRGIHIEIRPQRIHDTLSMELVARSKGEELKQALGLTEPPIGFVHAAISNLDAEATQYMDSQRVARLEQCI
jgi:hypothetical protein